MSTKSIEEIPKTVTLHDTQLLGFLGESAEVFKKGLELRKLKEGDILVKEGEPQNEMVIVETGEITKEKEGKVLNSLHSGEVSGLYHFFMHDPAHATLKATKPSQVWIMSSTNFTEILSKNSKLNRSWINFLSIQVRKQMKALYKLQTELGGGSSDCRIAFFAAKQYEKEAFQASLEEKKYNFNIEWFEERLTSKTAPLANGFNCVCCFVSDEVDSEAIKILDELGVGLVAMRCAGYDNVALEKAHALGLSVTRVPAYSPYAVAEFAVTLMLTLNRKVLKAVNKVKDLNFTLSGLVGFDMHGKTVGIIGTGKIGRITANILIGFGCKILAYDVYPSEELKKKPEVEYCELDRVFRESDIITLHAPLLDSTKHMINQESLKKMKKGVILINTSRGGLVDTRALLDAVKEGRIGAAGLDVVEGERGFFFEDKSEEATLSNEELSMLISFKNIVVTSHQAFLTKEALKSIADSTLDSINEYTQGKRGNELTNAVKQEYN